MSFSKIICCFWQIVKKLRRYKLLFLTNMWIYIYYFLLLVTKGSASSGGCSDIISASTFTPDSSIGSKERDYTYFISHVARKFGTLNINLIRRCTNEDIVILYMRHGSLLRSIIDVQNAIQYNTIIFSSNYRFAN